MSNKTPDKIWLIDMGDQWTWCDTPDPDGHKNDAVEYAKVIKQSPDCRGQFDRWWDKNCYPINAGDSIPDSKVYAWMAWKAAWKPKPVLKGVTEGVRPRQDSSSAEVAHNSDNVTPSSQQPVEVSKDSVAIAEAVVQEWTAGVGKTVPIYIALCLAKAVLARQSERESSPLTWDYRDEVINLLQAERDSLRAAFAKQDLPPEIKRVVTAACGVVAADTYVHPIMSRADAVKAGVAELHDAVNAYHSTQSAAAAPDEQGRRG